MGCAQSSRAATHAAVDEGTTEFPLESIGNQEQEQHGVANKHRRSRSSQSQQHEQDGESNAAQGRGRRKSTTSKNAGVPIVTETDVTVADSNGDGAGTKNGSGEHLVGRRSASLEPENSTGHHNNTNSNNNNSQNSSHNSNNHNNTGSNSIEAGTVHSHGSSNNNNNNSSNNNNNSIDENSVAKVGSADSESKMRRRSADGKGANISRRGTAETNSGNLRTHPSSASSSANNNDNEDFYGLDINYNDIELRESIGSGTYGQVFKCRYKGKQLALKKIFVPEGAMERAEMLEDFAKELGILSVLRHERIVQFKGAVRKHPTYALMFELCEGCVGTLLRMVRRRKVSVTWSICITIAKDCAEAVSYLHSLRPRILHRDLKSENLLLTSRFRCKLTDFGLSRVYEGRRRTMTVCGTPCWVAPEIFRGEAYNEKIDVYSFGVVLWELFTGRKPYTEYESVELPYRVGKKGLRPPLLKHVPPSINRLMRDCWHESPGMRPTFPEIEKRLAMIEGELNDASCLNTPAHQTKISWNQQVAHARQPSEGSLVPAGSRRSNTSAVA